MASTRKSLLNSMMKHSKRLDEQPMRVLFALDPNRFKRFSAQRRRHPARLFQEPHRREGDGRAVRDRARRPTSRAAARRMWAGKHINITEDRAVMHMALRYQGDKPVKVDGRDVMPDVRAVLARDEGVLRPGPRRHDQGRHRREIHRRRQYRHRRLRPRAGDGDAGARARTRGRICARTTSATSTARTCTTRCRASIRSARCSSSRRKTFTTDETMTNAHSARNWIADALGDKAVNDHFAARLDQPQGLRRASASGRTASSASGTGSAAAIRCGRPSACRSPSPSASTISRRSSRAPTRWTSISSRPGSTGTCR